MRIERFVYSVLILAATIIAVINWRRAALFAADNEELRARIESIEAEVQTANRFLDITKTNSDKMRERTSELMRLRSEVTQLRGEQKSMDELRAENEKLKNALSQRTETPAQAQPRAIPASDVFPRERWTFAGYASPESALVSAIWAMKEGNPETYLNSLAPQEQERMAKVWQEKTENEIAEKHRNDVAAITGLAIVERQSLSPSEMVMSVAIQSGGATRMERIRMNQVGQEWKFGGFIREQQP